MRKIGIIKNADHLGRISIPATIRNTVGFSNRMSVEMFVEDDYIRVKKAPQACLVTGDILNDNIKLADGKIVLSRHGAVQLLEALKKALN